MTPSVVNALPQSEFSAEFAPYQLQFRETAVTSRQSMNVKDTYFLRLTDGKGLTAYGECALFRGLSQEDTPDYEEGLRRACREPSVRRFSSSSVVFGFETARGSLSPGEETPWEHGERGIDINGLIWMGDKRTMRRRIREKLSGGFRCVKLKIGGIDFNDELDLLRAIRCEYSPRDIELRLDANGSFTPQNVLERLKRLSDFTIHSLEQPLRAGQWEAMAQVCRQSPIPIALDEELTGRHPSSDYKTQLLDTIRPQYIILKPSLCGGFAEADRWIEAAEERAIGWWATSALESDIGLNAIARWVSAKNPTLPQGLGTGQLYTNNIPSPLLMRDAKLWRNPEGAFLMPELQWQR